MIVLKPFAAKSSARSWTSRLDREIRTSKEGSHLGVDEIEAEDISEEEDDLIFRIVDLRGCDIALHAADGLKFPW
jgi:hypothetical protein